MPLWFSRKECSAVSWPLCCSIIHPLICLWRMRRPGLTNQCYGFFQNSTQSHKRPTGPLFSIRCAACIIHVVDRWTLASSWAYLAYHDSLVGATVMCRMLREFNVHRLKDIKISHASKPRQTVTRRRRATMHGAGSWYGKPHRIMRLISLSPASSLYLQLLNRFVLGFLCCMLTYDDGAAAQPLEKTHSFGRGPKACRKSWFPWMFRDQFKLRQFEVTGDEERNVPHRWATEMSITYWIFFQQSFVSYKQYFTCYSHLYPPHCKSFHVLSNVLGLMYIITFRIDQGIHEVRDGLLWRGLNLIILGHYGYHVKGSKLNWHNGWINLCRAFSQKGKHCIVQRGETVCLAAKPALISIFYVLTLNQITTCDVIGFISSDLWW